MIGTGPKSAKNLSLAATDLGLGDALQNYVDNMAVEVKKKKEQLDTSKGMGLSGLGGAVESLLGPSGGMV